MARNGGVRGRLRPRYRAVKESLRIVSFFEMRNAEISHYSANYRAFRIPRGVFGQSSRGPAISQCELPKGRPDGFYFASAWSMAARSSGASGVTLLGKKATIFPSFPITYLLKFHDGRFPDVPRKAYTVD